jgi:hypothetical protein
MSNTYTTPSSSVVYTHPGSVRPGSIRFTAGTLIAPLPSQTCTICTEPLDDDSILRLACCPHTFHTYCVFTYFDASGHHDYPNCRAVLHERRLTERELHVVRVIREEEDDFDEEFFVGEYNGEDFFKRSYSLRQVRKWGLEVERMPALDRWRLRVRTRVEGVREWWTR